MNKQLSENILHGITYASFFMIMALMLSRWEIVIDFNDLPAQTANLIHAIVTPCIRLLSSLYVLFISLRFVMSDIDYTRKIMGLGCATAITYLVVFVI